jgi:NADP-dependent aldehyde dehydrogenase
LELSGSYDENTQANFSQQAIATAKGETFLANKTLHLEVFGPFSLIIRCADFIEMETVINSLEGQLTGTIIAESNELDNSKNIINALQNRVGRLVFNGVPTGVEVCKSMHHGGPYPATSNSHFTAVGHDAITRWTRPISFQNCPDNLLPKELQNENSLDILRNIDGEWTKRKI